MQANAPKLRTWIASHHQRVIKPLRKIRFVVPQTVLRFVPFSPA
jgi:hypothetical protein